MRPFVVRVDPKEDRGAQLTVAGAMDAHTFERFFTAIGQLVDAGTLWLVIDLREMSHITSVGLNFLVNLRLQRKKAGGEVILVKPQPGVMNVLEMIGFRQVLVIVDTTDEAWKQIDALKPRPDAER